MTITVEEIKTKLIPGQRVKFCGSNHPFDSAYQVVLGINYSNDTISVNNICGLETRGLQLCANYSLNEVIKMVQDGYVKFVDAPKVCNQANIQMHKVDIQEHKMAIMDKLWNLINSMLNAKCI
jgi:hypothetical protein